MADAEIPRFFLYGEPARVVDGRFLHLEALDDRSRPSEWSIRAHSHPDLHHLFLIRAGSGAMTVEGRSLPFTAPCLLVVPSGAVHGFAFEAESAGAVITLAASCLDELKDRAPELAAVFAHAAALEPGSALAEIEGRIEVLGRELSWAAPGAAAAAEAAATALLVVALRLAMDAAVAPAVDVSAQSELVARFRATVSARARARLPLDVYAAELGVPTSRLRTACRRVLGKSPLALVQERRMLEARRLLAYTSLGVAQIAYSLGMEDAAYFSRAFTRAEGCSPRAYREALRPPAGACSPRPRSRSPQVGKASGGSFALAKPVQQSS